MTFAPDDLKAVQRYLRDRTGLPWASLGIVHGSPQGGGYHEGRDLLHQARRCPDCPGSDYSYVESLRDRQGLTDAASGIDVGDFSVVYKGQRRTLRGLSAHLAAAMRRGDPRARDIREQIYTPDGATVVRIDRERRRAGGDSSHLTHSHWSLYRDSEGRRDQRDNLLGLIMEYFGDLPADQLPEEDMDAHQAAQLTATDNRVRSALIEGRAVFDDVPGDGKGRRVWLVDTLNAHSKALAELAARAPVTVDAVVSGVAAAIGALELDLSAADVDQLGERLAAAVVARPDIPLGPDDQPAITAAVKTAIRDLVSGAVPPGAG